MNKKNKYITTLLCTIFTFTTFGMEPEQPNKSWLTLTENSLLYNVKPMRVSFFQDQEFE
jgi:hypothetical protein